MRLTTLSALFFSVLLTTSAKVSVLTLAVVLPVDATAQEAERKTRRVPTLRSRVYEQFSRAQAAADEDNVAGALQILDEVKDKSSSMNSYELAMMYNFYGFIYYGNEQFDKAIESFKLVVEQAPIPETFEQTTLFSLAQLYMMRGEFNLAVEALDRWEALSTGTIPPRNRIIKAQAYYQNKQYEEAINLIEGAIADHEAEGYQVDESWLILQRAVYYELKQPEKVKDVLVKMVKMFNEPKYWIQLAGMYGELEEERKQLAIMEAAYQQGFIETSSDTFNLAQLYYFNEAPYKSARLMEQAMETGLLERNLRNLKFTAQSWNLAKETKKAIPVMQEAAALSADGELDAQLSQLYMNNEQWAQAIAAADKAIEKGDLRNPGIPHLVKGMSLFNQKQYALALNELAEAEKYAQSKRMAQQWGQYFQSEIQRLEASGS
ncbi:tetratricopeptide repeat protein [Alteromonas sediminis]